MSDVGTEKIRQYLELQVNSTKKDISKIMEEFLKVYHERMEALELVLKSECDKILRSKPKKMVQYLTEQIQERINFEANNVDQIYNNIFEYTKSERELLDNYKEEIENLLLIIDAMNEINKAI